MLDVRNVFIVGGDYLIEQMFRNEGWGIVDQLEDADLVQFTGGEDVNPALYNQHVHSTVHFNRDRDEQEQEVYLTALEQGIPMAGICRGGQFLNVMNGGSLYQDVDNHATRGTHKAWLIGATLPIDVTSTHHQMMSPNISADYILLMTAHQSKRKTSMSNVDYGVYECLSYPPLNQATDVEALFYRNSRCLCFQPHPEYTGSHVVETREVYFTLLDRYLFATEQDEQLRDEG